MSSKILLIITGTIGVLLVVTGLKTHLSNNSKNENLLKIENSIESTNTTVDEDVVVKVNQPTSKKTIPTLDLPASRTVQLIGEVGSDSFQIAQRITNLDQSSGAIYLLINSPGGSVLDGASIVAALEAAKNPVYTVCIQICASMAAIIHQYGTKRLMLNHSNLMFHEAAGSLGGQFNQMKSRMKWIDRYVTKFDIDIATRVGIQPEKFLAMLPNEIWIDAEDAVKQNYADKIVNIGISTFTLGNGDDSEEFSQTKELSEKFNVKLGN